MHTYVYIHTIYTHMLFLHTYREMGERENESDRQRHKTFPLVDTSTEIVPIPIKFSHFQEKLYRKVLSLTLNEQENPID